MTLHWNANIVEPIGMTPGDFMTAQGGIALSPAAGTVDAAMLGVGGGMSGKGSIATMRFRAIAAGNPGIGVERVIGRNAANAGISVKVGAPVAMTRIATITELQPVVPNPSSGNAVLAFSLVKEGHVDLSIYSVDGRRIRTIASGVHAAGTYRFGWDGTDAQGSRLQSGVYFVRFEGPGVHKSRLVTLIT